MTRNIKGYIGWLLPLVLAIVVGVGFWQRQAIYDWSRLRGYSPPVAVAELASRDTMTTYSRHIFYVNHPQLIGDSTTFRGDCTVTEQTIVLGCYHPNENGIFVYNVSDSRLSGIQEVTSAHEMLHGAYDRLSVSDKDKVNKMLQDFYNNELKDQRILDTIKSYKQSEPSDLVNEMHSVFGTECPNLPVALENYYKRYFTNRSAVVAFSEKYETEFTGRSAKTTQLESQLKDQKTKIDSEESSLKAQSDRINSEKSQLDSLRSAGKIDEYNAGVATYNAEVDGYNRGVATYKLDVVNYNSLVGQYNAIAGELKQLYGAIDTRLQTETTR